MPGPPGEHGLSLREHDRRIGHLGTPRRVGGEVEARPRAVPELHVRQRVGAPHGQVLPLEPPIPRPLMRAEPQECVSPVVLPVGRVPPPRGLHSVHQHREGQAVALQRNLDPHRIAQRREHVDVLGEAIHD